MKKLILIPITLTALTPMVSMVGCDKSKEDPYVIKVNLNKGKSLHLEAKPFSLEKDITYTLSFDLTKWETGMQADSGWRNIVFGDKPYEPLITSFIYGTITYTEATTYDEIDQNIPKYFVGEHGGDIGVFFYKPFGARVKQFDVKFLSDTKQENVTVELNGS